MSIPDPHRFASCATSAPHSSATRSCRHCNPVVLRGAGGRVARGARRPRIARRRSLTTCAASTPAPRPIPCSAIRRSADVSSTTTNSPATISSVGRSASSPRSSGCWRSSSEPNPEALYVGARADARQHAGLHARQHPALVDASAVPRVWLCNRVTVQTHYDISNNIACVVAGRRPLHAVPARAAGEPVRRAARVHAGRPAHQHGAARPAGLRAIPTLSRRHSPPPRSPISSRATRCSCPTCGGTTSKSRERFNVLVNYWWDETPAWQGSPFEALLHAIMAVQSLPPDKREIWRKVFEHYVFQDGRRPGGASHAAPARHPGSRLAAARRNHPRATHPHTFTASLVS